MTNQTDQLDLPFPIIIGQTSFKSAPIKLANFLAAITKSNQTHDIDGLPPLCNPAHIDEDKAVFFIAWLNQNKERLKLIIKDKSVSLLNPELPLSKGHPLQPQEILNGEIVEIATDEIGYRSFIKVLWDLEIAIKNFKISKLNFDKYEKIVSEKEQLLERETEPPIISKTLDELMLDKHVRYRSLKTMYLNAKVISMLDQNFEAAELVDLEKMLDEYIVPPLNRF